MTRAHRQTLEVGCRVRHNYTVGHGHGTVIAVDGDGSARLAYTVRYDSGFVGPYTRNAENQEIEPLHANRRTQP